MTFSDWNFYWGESVLFTKRDGAWQGVKPMCVDDAGRFLHRDGTRLDDIADAGGNLKFQVFLTGRNFYAAPMQPFTSSGWMTYEPPLGYFILSGRLYLITSSAPRNRNKGLHQRRLRTVPALDRTALPSAIAGAIGDDLNFYDVYRPIVAEVARRLNVPFPSSWYEAIIKGIEDDVVPAVILHKDAAFVPAVGKDTGHLLFKGTLLGNVSKVGRDLLFTPRNKPVTGIETSVNEWVLSKLTPAESAKV
jgi:hypothetical protein